MESSSILNLFRLQMQYLLKMLKLLQILNRKLFYSRFNREQLQKDLYACLLKDKSFNDELYKVIHCGAYYVLYDVKQYRAKEYVLYARKYTKLVKKYIPNIDLKYPNNIECIYEKFKKDVLSLC